MLSQLDIWHLEGRRHHIIDKAAGQELTGVVIGEFLIQRRADAMRRAADHHATHDVRVNHRAAVMGDHVVWQGDLTGQRSISA